MLANGFTATVVVATVAVGKAGDWSIQHVFDDRFQIIDLSLDPVARETGQLRVSELMDGTHAVKKKRRLLGQQGQGKPTCYLELGTLKR